MTDSFEIGDEKYDITGNPTLGTVRKVQSMQTDLLLEYLDEDKLRNMESLEDESEIVKAIIDEGGVEAFEEVQWRRSLLETRQTISLAADHAFDSDDFERMPADTFREVREKSEQALGGNAEDFFAELGIGTSLSAEEMKQAKRNRQ
jgi:hypothetical protein